MIPKQGTLLFLGATSPEARDILIHEYFRVDLEMTWNMVKKDLPLLEAEVRGILQDLNRDEGAV